MAMSPWDRARGLGWLKLPVSQNLLDLRAPAALPDSCFRHLLSVGPGDGVKSHLPAV